MSLRTRLATSLTCIVLMGATVTCLSAADTPNTGLKPFDVTVRVFDPTQGLDGGRDYVLPVDSPDAEHAASSTMANAVSFTKKVEGGRALPVVFTCIKVEPR